MTTIPHGSTYHVYMRNRLGLVRYHDLSRDEGMKLYKHLCQTEPAAYVTMFVAGQPWNRVFERQSAWVGIGKVD